MHVHVQMLPGTTCILKLSSARERLCCMLLMRAKSSKQLSRVCTFFFWHCINLACLFILSPYKLIIHDFAHIYMYIKYGVASYMYIHTHVAMAIRRKAELSLYDNGIHRLHLYSLWYWTASQWSCCNGGRKVVTTILQSSWVGTNTLCYMWVYTMCHRL